MKSDVSLLLARMGDGDPAAMETLIPLVYEELRVMARARMARERSDHTMRPTELVAEAYLRLVGGAGSFKNRAHFFGAAASAMRRVLIDHARARHAEKRGGRNVAVTFEDLAIEADDPGIDLLGLNDALEALEGEDARLAQVVELRYFVGLSIEETAGVIGASPATVKRDWAYARAWLYDRMKEE